MGRKHSAATKAKISASLKKYNGAGKPATPGKPFVGRNVRSTVNKPYVSPYGGGKSWSPGEPIKLGKKVKSFDYAGEAKKNRGAMHKSGQRY